MNIYLCTLEHRTAVEYIDGWARYEDVYELELVVAPTRGKARAIFVEHVNLEFTDPMSIRKVKHDILPHNLKVGVMGHEYDVDDNLNLVPWDYWDEKLNHDKS